LNGSLLWFLAFEEPDLVDSTERPEVGDEERTLAESSCSPLRLGGEEGPEEIVAVSERSEVKDGIDTAEESDNIESLSVLIDDAEPL
jgi:hypothetical protein